MDRQPLKKIALIVFLFAMNFCAGVTAVDGIFAFKSMLYSDGTIYLNCNSHGEGWPEAIILPLCSLLTIIFIVLLLRYLWLKRNV